MLKVVEKRLFYYSFSLFLFLISLYLIVFQGFIPSIDFNGGAQVEILFKDVPFKDQKDILNFKEKFKDFRITEILKSEERYIIKMSNLQYQDYERFLEKLKAEGINYEDVNFTNISPTIGKELKNKAKTAIFLVLILISIYISFAFRKNTKPVKSLVFGLATLIALVHDVIISLGFVILNKFPLESSIVVALLTLAGYSIHDTIVVFDRIRENLSLSKSSKDLKTVIEESVSQTMSRSINTSLTTIIALVVSFLTFGGYVKSLILTLIFGIIIGTYSSIFIASPLVFEMSKFGKNGKN